MKVNCSFCKIIMLKYIYKVDKKIYQKGVMPSRWIFIDLFDIIKKEGDEKNCGEQRRNKC